MMDFSQLAPRKWLWDDEQQNPCRTQWRFSRFFFRESLVEDIGKEWLNRETLDI